jgi:hypothetical protein
MDAEEQPRPIEVLFSYAHEDEVLRDKLEKHLSSLKRNKRIVCWHDRNIRSGTEWRLDISENLDKADIILLLVSADFLDSDYCNTVEVARALERHDKKDARVIPVILQPVDWHDEKFAKLQALPRDGRPVARWSNIDEALLNVAKGIKDVVKELEEKRVSAQ